MKRQLLFLVSVFFLGIFSEVNAQSWSAAGSGTTYGVSSMTLYNGEIYATTNDQWSFPLQLQSWNGSGWQTKGTVEGDSYGSLPGIPKLWSTIEYNGEIYVGGNFAKVNSQDDTSIARYNATTGFWSDVYGPNGVHCGEVLAMAVYNGELYVGGGLCGIIGTLKRWNGFGWSLLPGLSSPTFALAVYNNELYAGDFSGIHKWNGSTWSFAGGGGPSGGVYSFAVYNGELYAGGEFASSINTGGNNIPTNNIAKWNGTTWSALGGGLSGTPITTSVLTNLRVCAITGYNNELYAAGNFTIAGGLPASCIAKWNGTNWSALGSGTNFPVNALVVNNNDLYVGGDFSVAGGIATNHVARWNTTCAPPVASITASGTATICSGGSVTLNANTGTGLSYQWKLNTVDISLATSSSYVANAAGSYACVITNSCGSTTSNSISVTVNSLPTATITAGGNTTFCSGRSVTLSANTGTGLTYVWKNNTVPISGAAASTYVAAASGNYSCVITNASSCSATSNSITVTVNQVPAQPGIISGQTSVCRRQNNVVYSIGAVSGATSYTWTVPSGARVNAGQGTNSISVKYGNVGGNITVKANNACGSGSVRTLAVTITCRELSPNAGFEGFNVNIYPNPSSDHFTLKIISPDNNPCMLVVSDLLGREIERRESISADEQIDFGYHLTNGIYFAEVIQGNERKVLKLIKGE